MDNKKHSCEKKRTYFLQYFIPVNRNSHFRNEKKKSHKNNAVKENAKFIYNILSFQPYKPPLLNNISKLAKYSETNTWMVFHIPKTY